MQVRDLSTVVAAVVVPLFVKGQRFGAASAGWVLKNS
jgi:hypothetical protein